MGAATTVPFSTFGTPAVRITAQYQICVHCITGEAYFDLKTGW
jgi:hypothetical protein